MRVATDEDFRRHVKARIAERSDALFDDQEAVAARVPICRAAATG